MVKEVGMTVKMAVMSSDQNPTPLVVSRTRPMYMSAVIYRTEPSLAPAAVGRRLAGGEGAEMGTVRGEDQDAARSGREQVPRRIHFHAVGHAYA